MQVLCGCGGLVMSFFFLQYLCDLQQENGMVMYKIYCYNKCSSGGLEIITIICKNSSILMVTMMN